MMLRRQALFRCSLIIFLLGAAEVALAQDPAARNFLDGIYSAYNTPNSPGTRINSKALLARYFTPSLAALIERDAQQAKAKNEPPELNGDPFIDAQDWDIKGLAIDLRESGKDRATATVKFSNFGEAREVKLELIKTGAGWRIDEIHWREGTLRGLYKK
jgi:hypothetical protein